MPVSRLKLAFLLAPIFPSIFIVAFLRMPDFNIILLTLLFALPFSYFSCLIIGLPLVMLLRKTEGLCIVNLAIGGAFFGSLVFYLFGFVFAALLGSFKGLVPTALELFWGTLLGVLVASSFGLIAGFPLLMRKTD